MVSVSGETMSQMAEYRNLRVSVVIPAYNEARNLPFVLPQIPNWVHEIILVDGHSIDDTIEVAQRLVPEIKIIRQTGKGKGNAIRCGLMASTGDIIVMMDADGSSDPQEMSRFIEVLRAGADFAKGSRFIDDGGSIDITALRKFGNRVLSWIVNLLFLVRFTDLCYGYNAFRKGCFESFAVDCEGFEVETLITLRVYKANLKIVEVPSYEHSRIYGTSHLHTFEDGWRVLKTILREWANGRSVIRTVRMDRSYQREGVAEDDLALTEQFGATQ
jgi:glycosyltransferase involved in cell wall biosynthesis